MSGFATSADGVPVAYEDVGDGLPAIVFVHHRPFRSKGGVGIAAVTPLPVLFIQGAGDMRHPAGSGHLADYLGEQLGDGFRVIAPEMPNADDPHYRSWRDAIERELAALDGPVVLVGHSFGGSVLLKYLAEGSFEGEIAGLFLASVPFWGTDFEEFALPDDFAARLPATTTFLYHSLDDPEIAFSHMQRYERELPDATARLIPGSEHSFVNGLPVLVDDIRGVAR